MAENSFRLFSRIPHKFFGMAGQYYRIGGREGIMAEVEAKLDIAKALQEIKRLLKKGGRLFICHISSRFTINEIHRQVPELSNDLIPDYKEMQQLLSSSGFGQINVSDGTSSYLAKAEKLKNVAA